MVTPDGNAIFSTFLGSGKAADGAYGVAIDQNDDVYVTGSTQSSDFPLLNPLQATNAGGMSDVFLAKISHGLAPASALTRCMLFLILRPIASGVQAS
jgi:hypothetical protein